MLEIAEAMDAPEATIPLMSAQAVYPGSLSYLYPPGNPFDLAPGVE